MDKSDWNPPSRSLSTGWWPFSMKSKRILKQDGILWLNIGDGYTSGNRGWRAPDRKNPARAMNVRPDTPEGLKPKDLLGVPWRLAFALRQDG